MAHNFISFRRSFRKMSVVSMIRGVNTAISRQMTPDTVFIFFNKCEIFWEVDNQKWEGTDYWLSHHKYPSLSNANGGGSWWHCLLFYIHQRFLSCRQPFGGQNFFRCRNAGGAWCWLCVVLLLGCGLLGVCSGEINWSQSAAGEEAISSRTQSQTRPWLVSFQHSLILTQASVTINIQI